MGVPTYTVRIGNADWMCEVLHDRVRAVHPDGDELVVFDLSHVTRVEVEYRDPARDRVDIYLADGDRLRWQFDDANAFLAAFSASAYPEDRTGPHI